MLKLSMMEGPWKQDNGANPVSFASFSSSESGLDAVNLGEDVVDAAPQRPLRILRMPLLDENYIQQRSVENLFLSRAPSRSMSRSSSRNADCSEQNLTLVLTEQNELTASADPDPHSYFEMRKRNRTQFGNGHSKPKIPLTEETPGFRATNAANQIDRQRSGNARETKQLAGGPTPVRSDEMANLQLHNFKKSNDPANENVTETDLVATRQPKPLLNDVHRKTGTGEDCSNQLTSGIAVSTPPRNLQSQQPEESNGCCDGTGAKLCYALVRWKYICKRFSIGDLFATLFSIGIFVIDVVTDLLLSLTYYRKIKEHEDYRFFFSLTLGLVVGPSLVIQIFSLVWVWGDFRHKKEQEKQLRNGGSKKTSAIVVFKLILCLVVHIFHGAVLFRHIRVLVYGFRSRYYEVKKKEGYRKHFDALWKYELHDVNMLRLLESFLESAPQLVLQIYILLMTKQVEIITVVSCICSLLALSTMMVAIQRAIRNANAQKIQLSIVASIVMFFWRLFTISSRVLAFALFLTLQPLAFLIFILCHWGLATLWIAIKGTKFCTKKALEYLFDGTCGLIYIFCFFNVHENEVGRNSQSRWRMLIFYLVVIAENSVFSILWFYFRPGGDTRPLTFKDLVEGIWQADVLVKSTVPSLSPTTNVGVIHPAYALGLILAVHGFFALGMVFMMVYYTLLHPRRTNLLCCCPASQRQRRSTEGKTRLVTTPDEQGDNRNPPARVGSRSAAMLQGMQPGSAHCLQRHQEAQQLLRRRRRESGTSSDNDGEVEARAVSDEWSKTVFNRGKRARKVYSRQYSREKFLDGEKDETVACPPQDSPRRTDRFCAIVTPVHQKRSDVFTPSKVTASATEEWTTARMNGTRPRMSSIVIRPGSRASRLGQAPRSATHQALRYYAQCSPGSQPSESVSAVPLVISPSRQITGPCKRPLGNHTQSAKSRDFSASLSCLTKDGRARPRANPQMQAAECTGEPSSSTFTIREGEMVESIESTV